MVRTSEGRITGRVGHGPGESTATSRRVRPPATGLDGSGATQQDRSSRAEHLDLLKNHRAPGTPVSRRKARTMPEVLIR